jgi:hypothetical protein
MDEFDHIESDLDKENIKSKSELLDDFLFFESYNLVLVKEDIKNDMSPFFLDYIQIYDLSDFIIYILFNTEYKLKSYNTHLLDLFTHTYNNELNVSYNIISKYLENFTKIKLDFQKWVLFCITYSNLTELI